MRIALDLQACQTESRHRGIGRYSLSLMRALLEEGSHDYILSLDATYPKARKDVLSSLLDVRLDTPLGEYAYPGPNCPHGHSRDALRPAAAALIGDHYSRLAPDIVHLNSLFEGFVEHAARLDDVTYIPGTISSVTLYDLIPLVYSEQYLANSEYRRWYEGKLRALRRFDVFLSLSEATSRDAIDLLGLDADRIHVIGGGVSPAFKPRIWPDAERLEFLHRLGVRDRFVLFTGNGDPRKNLLGAIRAFAALPHSMRNGMQLVLNQCDDPKALRHLARRAGLSDDALVITGYVSDVDLVGLLQNCEVFFFPSLYEGFGLPVLEAMACGAVVVAGDNSSIPEVLGQRDAMFDASSDDAATAALARVLADRDMREKLAHENVVRAKTYTWRDVARRTVAAWEHAHRRTMDRRTRMATTVPRMRIAMVTPLLPDATGIAAYVDEFAPALAKECDVDFFTGAVEARAPAMCSQVFDWRELASRVNDYDHVVYQFGNSPFHSHMFGMLADIPGTVVLHDFFLSSMFWHMDRHEGRPGLFESELEYAHGRPALRMIADEGDAAARRECPASRRILEMASAVIVHSSETMSFPHRYFRGLHRLRMDYLPMPICERMPIENDRRMLARKRLGITEGEFLCVSLGFVAHNKLSHELVEAVMGLPDGKNFRLVIVGANDGGDYGRELERLIDRASNGAKLSISGYVDGSIFSAYLEAADCAVQLRADSRGESSKTVLDCLAHGIPTIVNDYGAFVELPADTVEKLSPRPSPTEIAEAIESLRGDLARRTKMGLCGRAYIKVKHNPEDIAKRFVGLLRHSAELQFSALDSVLVRKLGKAMTHCTAHGPEMGAVQHALERNLTPMREQRIFVDLSEVVNVDLGTGIQRVVRNITRELMLGERPSFRRIIPVAHGEDGAMLSAENYTHGRLGVPHSVQGEFGGFAMGDQLLLLDSSWDSHQRFVPTIQRVRDACGRVGAMVYDLIPLRFPQYCVDYMPAIFESWLSFVIRECDYAVCISRSVADDLHAWIRQRERSCRADFAIGHIHLGADVETWSTEPQDISQAMLEITSAPFVLAVGTVEPRKRHDLILDAFEQAWAVGSQLRLALVGKQGWNVDALVTRIRAHSEFGRRLFWSERASDVDLTHAYSKAVALVQASEAEGFGLPIVEASHFGCPLLLSDIPVFREIAGDAASYFPAGDAAALAKLLAHAQGNGRYPAAAKLGIRWRECAEQLDRLLQGGEWDYVIGQ